MPKQCFSHTLRRRDPQPWAAGPCVLSFGFLVLLQLSHLQSRVGDHRTHQRHHLELASQAKWEVPGYGVLNNLSQSLWGRNYQDPITLLVKQLGSKRQARKTKHRQAFGMVVKTLLGAPIPGFESWLIYFWSTFLIMYTLDKDRCW